MKVILASKSPRRKELMDLLGINYEIMVSEADETLEEGLSLEEQSKKLGYIKAKAVFDKTSGDRIVIGSDTLVVKDGKLLGKPKDKQDAINMLNFLKNDKHQVITSIAILVEKDGEYTEHLECDIADVYVSDISNEEIEDWLDTGKAYDKAGAYAIQLEFAKFIEKIDGNYNTIVGLPINKVYQILKNIIYKTIRITNRVIRMFCLGGAAQATSATTAVSGELQCCARFGNGIKLNIGNVNACQRNAINLELHLSLLLS